MSTSPARSDDRPRENPREGDASASDQARTERLRRLAEEGAAELAAIEASGTPQEIAAAASAWAARTFGDSLAVACSMADSVLPEVVARQAPGVDVLFLDTGYHFAETLETRDRVERELDVHIVDVRAKASVPEQDAEHGPRLHDRDPGLCCAMRKVTPLRETLAGYDAWITGVRRDEGPTRADSPLVTFDDAFGLVKINPLVTWTLEEVNGYGYEHHLPMNPLLEQGFPSIGCAPCTRRVAPGEDPRAGRWAGFEKTECGLHAGDDAEDDLADEGSRDEPISVRNRITLTPVDHHRSGERR
ncbi:phosphoadenylyl-sulfate reductase [Brachybacterium endophyticum]|uniref:Adenosine 5'-phosphosulfate reductase n=1 Tax=Brachybacterium endophyticum TaxID=2182385 RepID=A0A2U2RHU1_9MICO|nr:phosphoadenylyl-sulfate reductase [Brachybacterium endophyticum]PWH05437.1 phosphoadenylyl-sulfate reductase [Brachybacterium endophyticum]